MPLLMAQSDADVFRRPDDRRRIAPGREGFERAVCLALAQAAAEAWIAGDIARRRRGWPRRRRNSGRKGRGRPSASARRRRGFGFPDDAESVALGVAPAVRSARDARGRARVDRPLHFPAVRALSNNGAPKVEVALDLELADLPPELRWREWMGRVEAVIFASAEPVTREVLTRLVGKACKLDLLIDDIRDEPRGRPYELVAVAGGWRHQTRKGFAEAIRAATGLADQVQGNDAGVEAGVLMAIAYFQPVTRGETRPRWSGREISRDSDRSVTRRLGLIRRRAAQPAARRTRHLCDDEGIPLAVRVRILKRSAGYRAAQGCRVAGGRGFRGCHRV